MNIEEGINLECPSLNAKHPEHKSSGLQTLISDPPPYVLVPQPPQLKALADASRPSGLKSSSWDLKYLNTQHKSRLRFLII